MLSLDTVYNLLLTYKYIIYYPLAVIEGPIATTLAGFLASMNIMNIFLIYLIAVLGDLTGDALFYSLGRWGQTYLDKYGVHVGITKEKLNLAREYFSSHHHKAVVFSKVFHGVGIIGLIAAGSLKIKFHRYFKVCFLVALAQSLIFELLGLFFGHTYNVIGRFLNYFAGFGVVLVLSIFTYFIWRKLKYSKTI